MKIQYERWLQALRLRVLYVGRIVAVCCFTMLLAACTNPFVTPSKSGSDLTQVTGVPSPTSRAASTPTNSSTQGSPTITLQVLNCPSGLSTNWDSLVGTKAHVNKVQTVICGSLEGSGSLDALIDVRYYSPDARMDFYVYDNLNGTPARRFEMQGLLDGDARISPTNTIITAEINPGDNFKTVPDVFKEYQWTNATFTQILFPGIYPDMTHYQAEQDQALANSNSQAFAWKASAYPVVDKMAHDIFHWNQTRDQVAKYDTKAGIYLIDVYNLGPGGGGFQASLFLLDNIKTNIFEVKQVSSIDGNTALSSPAPYSQLTSPVSVSGSAPASGSNTVLGQVLVYNDTFINVGSSSGIHSNVAAGFMNFTISIPYRLGASGQQEGAIAFFSTTQNNTALTNEVVVIKVFLSA